MSADLELYALPDTERTRALMARWDAHEWVGDGAVPDDPVSLSWEQFDALTRELFGWHYGEVPHIWIGQVSWAKAELDHDPQRWIPSAVARVVVLTEGGRLITPSFVTAVMVGMNGRNRSAYQGGRGYRGVARRQHVKRFLTAHLGRIAYAVSE